MNAVKKKKLLISALIVGACSAMWACGNESEGSSTETTIEITTQEETSTQQQTTEEESDTKEPETEEKVDVPVVKKEVFNNGGSVVKYGDDIYYWHYNKDSYVNMGLMGEFSINPTTKNALMCMHKDYSQETIIEAEAVGDIYIINDKLYFLRFIDGYETELCVLSQTDGKWDAASLEVICKGSIHEVDMEKEVCIIEKRNDNGYVTAIYNFTNGQITEVKVENETQVRYVGYYNGNIYVEASAKDAANGVLGEVAIYVADLSGASRLLVRTSADLYDFSDGDSCEIQCIQEYDGYVYYQFAFISSNYDDKYLNINVSDRIKLLPDYAVVNNEILCIPYDNKFIIDLDDNYFDEVDSLKKELDSKRPIPKETLKSLRESINLEWTYNSNGIEGNTLTLRETQVVLEGITVGGKSIKEHLEAINHEKAILFLDDLVKDNEPISEWNIKNIHFFCIYS